MQSPRSGSSASSGGACRRTHRQRWAWVACSLQGPAHACRRTRTLQQCALLPAHLPAAMRDHFPVQSVQGAHQQLGETTCSHCLWSCERVHGKLRPGNLKPVRSPESSSSAVQVPPFISTTRSGRFSSTGQAARSASPARRRTGQLAEVPEAPPLPEPSPRPASDPGNLEQGGCSYARVA